MLEEGEYSSDAVMGGVIQIGEDVIITGRIVGRSEFENGNVRYCVVIQRGGKNEQLWLRADEMEVDDAE